MEVGGIDSKPWNIILGFEQLGFIKLEMWIIRSAGNGICRLVQSSQN